MEWFLPNAPAAKVPDRLEVNVEVVRRRAKGVRDHSFFALPNSLQRQSHVRRQLEPAAPAERRPFRLLETAPRTALPLRELVDLLSGHHRYPSLSHVRANKKRPGVHPAFLAAHIVVRAIIAESRLQPVTFETSSRLLIDALAAERGLILVLTGAGISLASGIPTFRGTDEGAVWSRDVTELGTYGYFRRDPVDSWRWYRQRFLTVLQAKPNAAHFALAKLERWQRDRGGRFLLVSQNIDTLHEQAGAVEYAKVHGSADRARCSSRRCALGSTDTVAVTDLDFAEFEREPRLEAIPRCPRCDALMRPHVLWFDELYTSHIDYRWPAVTRACDSMSLVLAVGTSFSVGVTDRIALMADERRVPMFIVDPSADPAPAYLDAVHVREKAEELLPIVVETLIRRGAPQGGKR
ncbi:MAG: SIR2 family NAD-dependent protein deacylase [Thermoanaerobaculia bacterium]